MVRMVARTHLAHILALMEAARHINSRSWTVQSVLEILGSCRDSPYSSKLLKHALIPENCAAQCSQHRNNNAVSLVAFIFTACAQIRIASILTGPTIPTSQPYTSGLWHSELTCPKLLNPTRTLARSSLRSSGSASISSAPML